MSYLVEMKHYNIEHKNEDVLGVSSQLETLNINEEMSETHTK